MLDIKFLRENPDVVKKNIENKFQNEKLPLVDEVIELDQKKRDAQQEADSLRANRNKKQKRQRRKLLNLQTAFLSWKFWKKNMMRKF